MCVTGLVFSCVFSIENRFSPTLCILYGIRPYLSFFSSITMGNNMAEVHGYKGILDTLHISAHYIYQHLQGSGVEFLYSENGNEVKKLCVQKA